MARGELRADIDHEAATDLMIGPVLEFVPGMTVDPAVTLQPRDRTLTEAEIEAVSTKIIAQVTRATGATLRG